MIKVSMEVSLKSEIEVSIDMDEEEFLYLSKDEIQEIVEENIDWDDMVLKADIDEISVWDLEVE